jgi:hypothetical protein
VSDHLNMWTIYERPLDYPTGYIARRCEVRGEVVHTADVRVGPTLEAVRRQLPPGLYRQSRQPGDDPVIVEVWF